MFPKNIDTVVDSILAEWPEHSKFVARGIGALTDDKIASLETIAKSVVCLASDEMDTYSSDYRIMCGNINDEEYHFRRNGCYRFSTYDEVADFVYHNEDYMKTYMRGLLVSQVLWTNHVSVMHYYKSCFLNKFEPNNARHIEVGPGHGLFMHLALQSEKFEHCEGWDISDSSIEETRENLATLGYDNSKYSLYNRDALSIAEQPLSIDALTISEVLEHTENPQKVLLSIYRGMKPGSRIFVNIPLNCPAIDHIYLYKKKEEIIEQVVNAGFKLIDVEEFPVTGFTLERARKLGATISVVLIAERVA